MMQQPAEYEKYKSQSLRDSELFGPRLINEVSWGQNEVVVDYGCGAGSTGARFFLPTVKKTNSRMISVDCAPEMIAYAKQKYPDPSVTYLVGDIMTNPRILGIEAVDKILSVYTLQFIPDQREAYRRLWEALKPSGYLAFTMLTDITSFDTFIHLARHEKWGRYMKGYESFLASWITDEAESDVHQETELNLIESGFDVKKLETHKLTYHYDSVDTLVRLYMSVNPYIGRFPEELLPELRKEYQKFLIDLHGSHDDAAGTDVYYGSDVPVDVEYETIFAIAQKRMD